MDKMEENLINYRLSRDEGPPPDDEAFAETRLTKKFRKGFMKKYGMTETDLQDWQYCDGDYNKDQPWHAKFKENFKLNCEWPPDKDKCVCGVDIYYNCYITNRNRDFVITTGRCCIDKFLGPNRRRCEICHKKHRGRKDNMCKECRKTSCCLDCKQSLDRDEPFRKEQLCTECKGERNFEENQTARYEYEQALLDVKRLRLRAKQMKLEMVRRQLGRVQAPKPKRVECPRCKIKRRQPEYRLCSKCRFA